MSGSRTSEFSAPEMTIDGYSAMNRFPSNTYSPLLWKTAQRVFPCITAWQRASLRRTFTGLLLPTLPAFSVGQQNTRAPCKGFS